MSFAEELAKLSGGDLIAAAKEYRQGGQHGLDRRSYTALDALVAEVIGQELKEVRDERAQVALVRAVGRFAGALIYFANQEPNGPSARTLDLDASVLGE